MDYTSPYLICLNLIEFLLLYAAMNSMLTRKGSIWALAGTIAAVLPVYYIGSYFLQSVTILKLVFGIGMIFVPIALFYTDPILKRIALYAGAWMIIIITEVIIALVFGSEMPVTHPFIVNSTYHLIMGLLLTVFVLTVNSFSRKYRNILRVPDRLAMALFLFGQFVMLYGLIRLVRTDLFFKEEVETPVQLIILSLILCGLSDVLLLHMLIRSARATRTEVENAVLTRQVDDQKKYYTSLNAQYETIRHMRHDIANHIYTVKALLNDRKVEEAEKYTEKLSEEHEKLALSKICDHPVVDAFLTSRIGELEEEGIEVRTDITLPRTVGIGSIELITALGNLIDNAEEACMPAAAPGAEKGPARSEKPVTRLDIGISGNVLIIRVCNPAPPEAPRRERILNLSRGNGTRILNDLAEKNGGHYEFAADSGECAATLCLQLN